MEMIHEKTKLCPSCGNAIKVEVTDCPHCHAKFAVTYRGYCATEHAMQEADSQGLCLQCGNAVVDPLAESTLVQAGSAPIEATPLPVADEASTAGETKQCPDCAETIKAEAVMCRFCGARFEVTRRGYCSTDHDMMDVDELGKCRKCGNPVMDIHTESRVISEKKPVPTPAAADMVEWVIEPIRGEGVNWRFNGVFIDAILIQLIYGVMAVVLIGLTSVVTGNLEDLAGLYSGIALLLLPVVWFLYFFLFEWITGATPGKKGSLLKVIRKDGGRIEWWQAAIRAFFSIFEDNIIGAIVIWSTPLKQRIADLIAGTLVVNREKLYKVEYRPNLLAFQFHDYRRVEFARVTGGILHKFGLSRQITLDGISPTGEVVRLHWNAQFQQGEVDRIRNEIEQRYGTVFSEKLILSRIILMIFGIMLLIGAAALVFVVLNS